MNFRFVFKIVGLFGIFESIALLLPLPFSFYYGDGDHFAFIISSAIVLAFGLSFFYGFRTNNKILKAREGFLIVTLSWVLFTVFGALPYMFTQSVPTFIDAFFESVSGFTTTGSSILTNIEATPHGVLFWRSLTHWFGGMGIIVMTIAIIPFLGTGSMFLFRAESTADRLHPRLGETAKVLWGVYIILTAAMTIALLFGGMNLFDSLCHTFGALGTGGFSPKNASIGFYKNDYIEFVVIFFMIMAGSNFALHYRWMRGDFRSIFKNPEWRFFLGILAIATLIVTIDVYKHNYSTIYYSFKYAAFQVSTLMTSTGFATADYEKWPMRSQVILYILMYIGGSVGSTSGGIKVLRFYALIKFALVEINRLIHPQAIIPIRIGDTVIDKKTMMNILGFFFAMVIVNLMGVLLITTFDTVDFHTALGAVAGTYNGVGPGFSMCGPMDNFAFFSPASKMVLSSLMLLGRLEIFTILIIFLPAFWKK
jgi:trk system potassium uptake protein TrkH